VIWQCVFVFVLFARAPRMQIRRVRVTLHFSHMALHPIYLTVLGVAAAVLAAVIPAEFVMWCEHAENFTPAREVIANLPAAS
jgi:hypothetical protein